MGRVRRGVIVVASGVVGFGLLGVSCQATDCDTGAGPPEVEFVGTVTEFGPGSAVVFAVDEVRRGEVPAEVNVTYLDDSDRFLREGRPFLVSAQAEETGLTSYVKTAKDCAGGTVNANGSPIDTGVFRGFSWGTVVRWVLLPIGLGIGVLMAVLWLLGRRTRQLEHEPS